MFVARRAAHPRPIPLKGCFGAGEVDVGCVHRHAVAAGVADQRVG